MYGVGIVKIIVAAILVWLVKILKRIAVYVFGKKRKMKENDEDLLRMTDNIVRTEMF